MMIALRPAQEEILKYKSGWMGISAVPGSGKTWTLSYLAAMTISSGHLQEDQEVLVVTLVNSAVDNFNQRIDNFVHSEGLLPHTGYRVRTLHGLAHDIVRERPGVVSLGDNFQIIDENEAASIRHKAARSWLKSNINLFDDYLDSELKEEKRAWIRREELPKVVSEMALILLRTAKDLQKNPKMIRERLDTLGISLPLAEMAYEIYEDYQQALSYRGAVDFDDLIRLALLSLESDQEYLLRLRHRWPYILEDEAQDSSHLQERILGLLSGLQGNWVRMGDPNQAIYETFTTADPGLLINFLQRPDVVQHDLPNSGRSTRSIINLANYLVRWTQEKHPLEVVRDALRSPPLIVPTSADDPQPNPQDAPAQITLVEKRFTPMEEVQAVADSLNRWLPEHKDWTVAVLAPRNQRGFDLIDELKKRNLPFEDSLLKSSSETRSAAGSLGSFLNYLADPMSSKKLAEVYSIWRRLNTADTLTLTEVEQGEELLRKLDRVEDFLWPAPHTNWLNKLEINGINQSIIDALSRFCLLIRRWHSAVLLPVDQLILTIAQELFSEPGDLAIAHKLASVLNQASQNHTSWRLPEFHRELTLISKNERRFLGFGTNDMGFDPTRYKGKVVVATIHKAKGLEWDRVYLMSVNNYDFPSGGIADSYIAEKWFLRDHLNLEAEAKAQLETAFSMDEYSWYQEGRASEEARHDYIRERLRLLYVGITRAKRELVITWNTGRGQKGEATPALPLVELQNFMKSVAKSGG